MLSTQTLTTYPSLPNFVNLNITEDLVASQGGASNTKPKRLKGGQGAV
jgi:hypothetical protein